MLDCQKINIGEVAVKNYLRQQGRKFIDVSKDPDYYNKDIDLLEVLEDGTLQAIEVKYDTYIHHTHSFFIELLADEARNKEGWIYKTEADFIYYVDIQSLDCYIFRPDEMRQYIATTSYEKKKCYKDGYKVSEGAIIPIGYYWLDYDIEKINLYQTKG